MLRQVSSQQKNAFGSCVDVQPQLRYEQTLGLINNVHDLVELKKTVITFKDLVSFRNLKLPCSCNVRCHKALFEGQLVWNKQNLN